MMKEPEDLILEAERKLNNVDHLLSVTFPLVNDSKILAPIAETLGQSALKTMEALLRNEYNYKRIKALPNNLEIMHAIFKSVAVRYKLNKNINNMLSDLKNLIENRKKSAAEFTKGDKYIICTNEYSTTVITSEKLKNYMQITNQFITQVKEIMKRR